jgi:DNA-binding LacI/PurR family transcriptional regulator
MGAIRLNDQFAASKGASPVARPRASVDGRQPRATIESVAEHAHVSRQTVSNALNAPHRLRPDTLERVLRSISDLGYRPNHAARTLRTQATRLVACRLMPSSYGGTEGVLDRFLHVLCEACRHRGYDVLSFAANSDEEEIAVYDDLLRRTAVDGFLIAGTHFVDPRTAWLRDRGAPFVAFGRPWGLSRPGHSWVDVDGAQGVADAVEHLVGLGHRRIGFVGWPEGSGVGDDRRSGWLRQATARRLPVRGLDVRGEDGIASGASLTERLLDAANPPTAIVCVSDAMAVGALDVLADRGLQPGRDVAVVGFDDSLVASVIRPGLTSVRQPLEQVAEKVVELLLEHLSGTRTKPARVLLPPALVIRGSSAASPRARFIHRKKENQ